MTSGTLIRQARMRAGLSQGDLSERSGKDRAQIARWERDVVQPSLETLRELGLERRAIDAVFRALPVVAFPGYSRPMIRADAYYALIDASTYRDDRVRARNA